MTLTATTTTAAARTAATAADESHDGAGMGFDPLTADETVYLHDETAADALAVVLRLRGYRVLVEDIDPHGGRRSGESIVMTTGPAEPDRYRVVSIGAWTETQWLDVAYDNPTKRAVLRRPLMDMSLAFLHGPLSWSAPLMGYLSGEAWTSALTGPEPQSVIDAARGAALRHWWTDRMAEGHSPGPAGSAALLLALLLPAPVMSAIVYDPTGTPSLHPPHA